MMHFVSIFILCIIVGFSQGEVKWWSTTSMYQVYPLSLQDSDGDGYGDLQGVISKITYFQRLGIETLWLTPIYSSPMKDFGYDVSDYCSINPIFGTIEDFEELLEVAHSLELRVLMDFVPNHSSDEHEWFKKSVAKEDPYTDYYVWVDPISFNGTVPIPPTNWLSKVRTSAWQWSDDRQQFYYHQYQAAQPDLNYRNRHVIEEMKDVLDFWLDLGINGVRMDAVSHLIEDDRLLDEPFSGDPDAIDNLDYKYLSHTYTNNQGKTRDMLTKFTEHIKSKYGDKSVILETDLGKP